MQRMRFWHARYGSISVRYARRTTNGVERVSLSNGIAVSVSTAAYSDTAQREAIWQRMNAWAADIPERCARARHRASTEVTVQRVIRYLANVSGDAGWECSNLHRVTRRRRSHRATAYAIGERSSSSSAEQRGTIQSYSYKPTPRFRHVAEEGSAPRAFFGVELEVDDTTHSKSPNVIPPLCGELFYCKHDGSLTNGCELVSHPSTEGWWRSQAEAVKQLLQAINARGFKSHDARTCGMHVHISKAAFDSAHHMYRFLHLVYRAPKLSLVISQRQAEQLARWAKLGPAKRAQLKAKAGLPSNASVGDRYEAVNVTTHTLEVRMFNGTLRPARFFKNLEYCWAAVAFTREVTNLRKVNGAGFVRWVYEHEAQYPNLAGYFRENSKSDAFDTSDPRVAAAA